MSLIEAVLSGDPDLVGRRLRICSPNEQDERGRTGAHLSAARGSLQILSMLVDAGADLSLTDLQGNTPLHYCGHREIIQLLVDSGADMAARNKRGDTPLVLMERRGVEESALEMLRGMLSEAVERMSHSEDGTEPLLSETALRRGRGGGLDTVRSVWMEFCTDLGPEKLAMVILVVLVLSLYVAYVATGYAKQYDSRIPINLKEEL